jgi:hypothetical protein
MSSGEEAPILRRVSARHSSILASLLFALLSPAAPGADAAQPVTVPALTPVIIRLEETLSSNKSKPGDRFKITVAEDVRVGDAVVIPAGSPGEGEVVHAARSGAGGKAGELILAARFVHVGDIEVRLRSFALGVAGKDHTNDALASSFLIGPFAMFVKGGVITVPAATQGTAKTALEFSLPKVESEESSKGGEENESKVD